MFILGLNLATAQGEREVYLEYDHFFTDIGHFENANLGLRIPLSDFIDLHYTFGVKSDGTQRNFVGHFPMAVNLAPLWLVGGDSWGVSVSLMILTAVIPEGISVRFPLGYDESFYLAPFVFPLTTDIIRKDELSDLTISWSGSFGMMMSKETDDFTIRTKIAYKYNPATAQFGPNIGMGIGYLF